MELFSEIYNCYYQVVRSILTKQNMSSKEIVNEISQAGYEESVLFLLPKLMEGDWQLLKQNHDLLISQISQDYYVPLSTLQKSFLKSLLLDDKICLFLSDEQILSLQQLLSDVEPLWLPDDFLYYDCFSDGDDFTSPDYIKHFRLLLDAIKHNQYVHMLTINKSGDSFPAFCLPCRLEYSIRNNKFRLLSLLTHKKRAPKLLITNLERIQDITLSSITVPLTPDLNKCIQDSYYKEPVKLLIHNERNTLERAMLQFANYNKNTTKIDDNTYECLIYYNQSVETELLIEILSFGPTIKVIGHEKFLSLVKQRLHRQRSLIKNLFKNDV